MVYDMIYFTAIG